MSSGTTGVPDLRPPPNPQLSIQPHSPSQGRLWGSPAEAQALRSTGALQCRPWLALAQPQEELQLGTDFTRGCTRCLLWEEPC